MSVRTLLQTLRSSAVPSLCRSVFNDAESRIVERVLTERRIVSLLPLSQQTVHS